MVALETPERSARSASDQPRLSALEPQAVGEPGAKIVWYEAHSSNIRQKLAVTSSPMSTSGEVPGSGLRHW